jgi:hypothetical protein
MDKPKFWLLVLLLIVILSLGLSMPAFATSSLPDSISITNSYVNRNLIETGDALFLFVYNIAYTSYPTTPADQAFVFSMFTPDGSTEIGNALPYPYVNQGYGYGLVAFYYSAADAIVYNSAYRLKITSNPLEFSSSITYTYIVPSSAYSSAVTQSENQTVLAQRIFTIANLLQTRWGTNYDLTSQQDALIVLSSQGEAYFRNTVYGLQVLAPSVFYLQSASTMEDIPGVMNQSLSDTYKNRFSGTWVQDSLDAGADLFSIPLSVFEFILCALGCAYAIYISQKTWQNPYPGYFTAVIIMVGFSILMMGMTLIALVVFGAVILTGFMLFFKRA